MAQENVVPKDIMDEAAEVERALLEAEKAAQLAAPPVAEITEPAKAAESAVVEPAPAPAAQSQPDETPQPEAKPASAEQPEPDAELRGQYERLQHSHDVLKGKYSKEIPRLHAELRGEREARLRVQAELAEAKKAQAAQPEDPQNPYGLTDAELELGPEVSAVAEKIGKRLAAQAVAELEKKIPQRQAEQQGDPFWEDLLIEEPDALEINTDPAFVSWLQGRVYGVSRQKLIMDAQREGDAKRAAAMMADWKASDQSAAQAAPKPATTGKQTTRPTLAAQVVPNTVAASPGPAPKKTYTLAEYEAAMLDISKGRYLPQRAREVELELDQAIREGRVR